ncbi:MAG: hypothetical protein K0S74_964 [Chlamydiales bacterium]|jgi:1,4-dihydroxy-6-naphthoate synthase|nr:hypothetical protein [Chlamydiales bacterium]
MEVAFSPCPNDSFLFHAWTYQLIKTPIKITPVISHVQQLNEWCLQEKYPVSKISLVHYPAIAKYYYLLPIGVAFGYGTGPKILATSSFPVKELPYKRIAIPGKETTANFLYNCFFKHASTQIFCKFDQVISMIADHCVDCGIVIHEEGIAHAQHHLVQICDLGELWHHKYQLPLPLGGIVAHRSLAKSYIKEIIKNLEESLNYAFANPVASLEDMLTKSIAKDPKIAQKHIEAYVTAETRSLSQAGMKALNLFFKILEFSQEQSEWLFE